MYSKQPWVVDWLVCFQTVFHIIIGVYNVIQAYYVLIAAVRVLAASVPIWYHNWMTSMK